MRVTVAPFGRRSGPFTVLTGYSIQLTHNKIYLDENRFGLNFYDDITIESEGKMLIGNSELPDGYYRLRRKDDRWILDNSTDIYRIKDCTEIKSEYFIESCKVSRNPFE
jgi:hypothetical protein